MSAFLPDNQASGSPIVQGGESTGTVDRAFLDKVFGNPQMIPQKFWAYMVDYLSVNQPQIPISQVFGFAQFTAQSATSIATNESTSSASYTDLATVGPSLSALPDGKYVFLYGCALFVENTTFTAWCSLKVNSTEGADTDAVASTVVDAASGVGVPGAIAVVKTLSSSGNNSVSLRYKMSGGAGSLAHFKNRWLLAIRYANT